jgi:hypothetical protein
MWIKPSYHCEGSLATPTVVEHPEVPPSSGPAFLPISTSSPLFPSAYFLLLYVFILKLPYMVTFK